MNYIPFLIAIVTCINLAIANAEYDPLTTHDEVFQVEKNFRYGDDHREVPLRVYLPKSTSQAPVILFSHGLGGSRDGNPYLGNHWSSRGYVVVFMQHAGSDRNVMDGLPLSQRLSALKMAANGKNSMARNADVKATLDQLEEWNESDEELAGRMDLSLVGMSGHSFGAVTTQAVSGQNAGLRGPIFTDDRIDASVAFSPSTPSFGYNPKTTFAKVKIPWLLMTGTKDSSPIGGRTTAESRRHVFRDLPKSGFFYEVCLEGAEHSAFSDRKIRRGGPRNPNHHASIKAISTAFWDCYLKKDESAKQWLDGRGPRSVLEPKDEWKHK